MSVRPIIFGEALFDVFPDGRRVLGGAPFNVAWHLEGFGLEPRLVSRVGRDDLGREILERMSDWGLSIDDVQLDDLHPTGRVRVALDHGNPSFSIEADQSYDHIDAGVISPDIDGEASSLLYHGSLAIRCDDSWNALQALGKPVGRALICDLNLRPPWWNRQRVDWCLERADWLKLNENELHILTERPTRSVEECLQAALLLARQFQLENLVVTRGSRGAMGLFEGEVSVWQDPVPLSQLVDTVGAGDAFSAMLILGVLGGWDRRALLERAARFASEICSLRGATTSDRSLYERQLRNV